MSTETLPLPDAIPMDADAQAVIDKLMTGKPVDPASTIAATSPSPSARGASS